MPENQEEQQHQQQPQEPKRLTLALETAIASVAGAAIGIGSAILPSQYALPLALGAAIVVPKKNKGFSTALVLVLSWLIMFTIFYKP